MVLSSIPTEMSSSSEPAPQPPSQQNRYSCENTTPTESCNVRHDSQAEPQPPLASTSLLTQQESTCSVKQPARSSATRTPDLLILFSSSSLRRAVADSLNNSALLQRI